MFDKYVYSKKDRDAKRRQQQQTYDTFVCLYCDTFVCVIHQVWIIRTNSWHRTFNVQHSYVLVTWYINLSRWFVQLSLCPTVCDLSLKLLSWPMVNRWYRFIWGYDHTSLPSVHAHLSYDVSHHNNSIREYPHVQPVRTMVTGGIPEDDKAPLIIQDAIGHFHFRQWWLCHMKTRCNYPSQINNIHNYLGLHWISKVVPRTRIWHSTAIHHGKTKCCVIARWIETRWQYITFWFYINYIYIDYTWYYILLYI